MSSLSASPSPLNSPTRATALSMDLTPRSKVKAMLASLDDDDDDDDDEHNGSDKENQGHTTIPKVTQKRPSVPLAQNKNEPRNEDARPKDGETQSPATHQRVIYNYDSDSDDDGDIVAPRARRGTLAARMQLQARTYSSASEEEEPRDAGNAYERVKRRLLSKETDGQSSHAGNDSTTEQEEVPDADILYERVKRRLGLTEIDGQLYFDGHDSATRDQEEQGSMIGSDGEGNITHATVSPKARTHGLDLPDTPLQHTEARVSSRSSSASRSRSNSPGLFVSPDKPPASRNVSSPRSNATPSETGTVANRLQALLVRKRREMEEKTRQEATQDMSESSDGDMPLQAQRPSKKVRQRPLRAESETDEDQEVSKKLTQQARPTRKASKKALEEMNRETQRMSRNMQLTHEARTKTKFQKEDFLAKFNFRQPVVGAEKPALAPLSSSAQVSSDAEALPESDTPPSSPPSVGTPQKPMNYFDEAAPVPDVEVQTADKMGSADEELPDLNTLLTQVTEKQRLKEADPVGDTLKQEETAKSNKRYSIRRFEKSVKPVQITSDSEDDLEIIKPMQASRLAVFDNLPASKARESNSLHALRALAHLNDTGKVRNRGKKSMTPSELQALLRRRAKEQANNERDEKLQRLREKGILVQTAEEKEQEQMQLENMLERARKEAEEIAQREKEAAKREGRELEDSNFPDSDEDEDYQASADEADVELSGSEDEAEGDVDELGGEDGEEPDEEDQDDETGQADEQKNFLLDNEADEDGEDEGTEGEDEADDVEQGSEDESELQPIRHNDSRPGRRKKIVISDDEDEDERGEPLEDEQRSQQVLQLTTPKQAIVDAFGFAPANPASFGLSQMFAGTMAQSQTQLDDTTGLDSQQDSMAFLRGLPPPDLPDFTTPQANESHSVRVEDSQVDQTPTHDSGPGLFDTQTQFDAQSDMPDPTQDIGFQVGDSQAEMTPSYATVDTVPLADSPSKVSQPPRRKGRLVRKIDTVDDLDVADDTVDALSLEDDAGDGPTTANVFEVMREAAKRPVIENFDKKKSEAKGMVEEQAEESEDEYAGLGGASDDESTGDLDEETKKMIDDNDNAATNERDIAAYYAERERLEDEKGIERLYKDVVNGGLRRKRGANDDLWESDDEDEKIARRRAAKQREFAKMRKALLADEKLGKIAENPKQQAFLQAIEDRDESFEIDLLDEPGAVSQIADSQSGASQILAATMPGRSSKRKYSDIENGAVASQKENMPPNLRRTGKATRPTSLADIRNTLSEIIGEPESILESQREPSQSPPRYADDSEVESEEESQTAGLSDHEDLYESPQEMPPPAVPASQRPSMPAANNNSRRTPANMARTAVIDRMALKRAASSSTISMANSQSRLAFHASSKSNYSSFRVPSLLRRATTSSSTLSASSTSTASGSETNGGLGSGKEVVKMGGTKKSSVNYYVRETERRAKVEQVEKERQQGRERVGKMRRSAALGAGIGALVGGSFD